jgi:hypothetical protein
MLEFTSIDSSGDRKSNTGGSVVGSLPLEIGGFNPPNDWGEDLGNLGLSVPRGRDHGDAFEIGNLAALEDDPLSGRVRPISSSPPGLSSLEDSEPPPPSVAVPSPRRPPAVAVDDDEPFPNPRGSKAGLVAAVVAVVLLAGGAAAYFGGLIPH